MIFQNESELILIKRILIGFEDILEIISPYRLKTPEKIFLVYSSGDYWIKGDSGKCHV